MSLTVTEASGLVDGLVITNEEPLGKCEDCIIRNQKCCAYDEKVIAETEVLQLTNIDLWGPAHVVSAGGAHYEMKFHDNGSLCKQTFFIPNHTAKTTLTILKVYKLESEKITGKLMVFIHTNNAPKFKSKLWVAFFAENGLIMVLTAPYSSGFNGTAKCLIGISTGSVRVMLNDVHLSAKWWAEAWVFSETVDNLLPSACHPGVIPEERFTGERQDVGHIRV